MLKPAASGLAAKLAALTAQLAAVALLARGGTSTTLLLAFLAMQAAAAALTALVLWRLLPLRMRAPFRWSFGFLALFCFLVPLGGPVVWLGSHLLARLLPRPLDSRHIGMVGLPQFVTYLMARVTHNGGGRLRAQLANIDAPLPERLTALAAMQSMPARTSGPLLRELLADSTDDIRLLAYGMLDGAEKQLTQQILAELPKLDTTPGEAERARINKKLAGLYWELIYQNLVQGDVYRYTAEQAERHARAALEHDASDAALWFLRGRLALALRAPAQARASLERAATLGFARQRVLPLLAEAAYQECDYASVRALMASIDGASPMPVMRPLLRYWKTGGQG